MNGSYEESQMPDPFDRQLAMLHDLPDVVKTKVSNIRVIPTLGVGGAQTFNVQTYRQREKGDTIFLEVSGKEGMIRLVIPDKVAALISRQRDSLTTMARRKIAKARAEDLKAQGIVPGFMRGKK